MPIHKTKLEFDPFHIDSEVLQKMDHHNKLEKDLRDKYLKMKLKLKKQEQKLFNDFMKESDDFAKRKDEVGEMMERSLKLDRDTIAISKKADVVLMKSVPK